MEEIIVDQSPAKVVNKSHRWKVYLRLAGVALLLSLALGSNLALNYLVPRAPGSSWGVADRVNWYFQSGQQRADLQTLASAFRFVMGTESDTGNADSFPALPVAEKATSNLPKI